MELGEITALILTYNEEPNIGRCLDRLTWAGRIIVIDSGSTDRTREICAGFPNVEVVPRAFDSFARQCNFGLSLVRSRWVLSLDSDYLLPEGFADFVVTLADSPAGFRFPFRYCVQGQPLRACLYPPRTILYRPSLAHYEDDGHGHKVRLDGEIFEVSSRIDHDDRKPLSRWLDSQRKYAALEAEKLIRGQATASMPDRLRQMVWPAAPAAFLYTLLAKGMILDGWPGWHYVLQRTYAELLLSLELLDRKLAFRSK